jgi:hypothetical protein
MHYLQPITWFYDFFLRKTKIFQKLIKPTKNFFWPKQKNMCFMILNDKPNCQVSRILMNPRPILSDSSENRPAWKNWKTLLFGHPVKNYRDQMSFFNWGLIWSMKYMKNKTAKGEINPRPIFRKKSLFQLLLIYCVFQVKNEK